MKISVLLPAKIRNPQEAYWFWEACFSLLNNHIKADQVVIVDDASTFWTNWRMYECFDIIHLKESQGLANALNKGLKECKHELVLRMDADDIARPTLIGSQKQFFEKNPYAVICGVQLEAFHYQTGEKCTLGGGFPTKHPAIVTPDQAQQLGRQGRFWWVNHPGITFRKDVILSMGGYVEGFINGDPGRRTPGMEDMKLWLKMSKAGIVFYNLPEVLINYRWKPSNRNTPEYHAAHNWETQIFLK
jgi:glycosyltransferase involved in cell wall biosynthesis